MSWAMGQALASNPGYVLKSSDGGLTWSQLSVNITTRLRAVDFVSPKRGWIGGTPYAFDTMRHTFDGGDSWQTSNSPVLPATGAVHVRDLDFVSSDVGFLAGGTSLWRTDDGGSNWNRLYPTEQVGLEKLFFLNENVGWAYGSTMVRTLDGGNTWQTTERFNHLVLDAHFTDDSNGWIVGIASSIRKTEDGGETFTGVSCVECGSSTLKAIDFVDADHGWVVGTGGTIVHSNDGGNTWTAQSSGTTESLNEVDFIDSMQGWAVGEQGTLLRTADGGNTWVTVDTGVDYQLYDVVAVVPEPATTALCILGLLCLFGARQPHSHLLSSCDSISAKS